MGLKGLIVKSGMKIKKVSPELCMIAGLGCFVGAVVTASKATLKVDKILEEHHSKRENIESVRNNEEFKDEYTNLDYKKDLTTVYAQTGLAFAKNYAIPAGLFLAGTFFVLGSYKILKTRYALLSASYTGLQKLFSVYRERVKNDAGIDKDLEYMYGAKKKEIIVETVDDKGKKKEKKETVTVLGDHQYSPYARYFDESCSQWTKDHQYNLEFILNMQRIANEKFHASVSEGGKGFLCLNEVYELLGIPKTQVGQQVGWVEGNGDDFIDFGVHTGYLPNRNFVNGYERTILLDFNVDGYIIDKI